MLNVNNIKDLEQLHTMIEVTLREHGNMPLNVSVLQDDGDRQFGAHYEDRQISADSCVVDTDGHKMFELYI